MMGLPFGSLTELIQWGGLLALFIIVFAETGLLIGFFLPGDSLLFTAGVLAAAGLFDVKILILVLLVAAITGDAVGYWTGRIMGQKLFQKKDSRFFKQEYVRKAHDFYERNGGKTIILARFIPIIRTFAPIVAGVANMKYRNFFIYNIIGALIWVMAMVLGGYYLIKIVPGADKYIHIIIGVIILVSLIPVVHEYWKGRKAHKAARS
jgi:membrane-associated protein